MGTGGLFMKSLAFARQWFLPLCFQSGCHPVSYTSEIKNNYHVDQGLEMLPCKCQLWPQGQGNQGFLQNLPLGSGKQAEAPRGGQSPGIQVCPDFPVVRVSV